MNVEDGNLSGQLLIAMPQMGDFRFDRSVVYMCAHSDEGAMGLIVNKPARSVDFADLLKQLEITMHEQISPVQVHVGGPVENARGFVLHTKDYQSGAGTLTVSERIAMTATMDVLEDIARGQGPEMSMLALGYAGWGPGQLESEIAQNGWLTCDATDEILFGLSHDSKWTAALNRLGVDPLLLSDVAGHA
jgi:putative transcriptional regulator